uniref:E-beta-farnesene synthase n=1 Tax=Tanacetum cinerariifolium TaxID=118510 RepID=A0A699L3T9_TANCI|nr:E-beta-farnesene synthase [Tanacetum cinerariifolium]
MSYVKDFSEEFTQSIHSFIEYKKNLELQTQGKKKDNPIVIPSIRFTKLIIHYLQSNHKFHPRPDSPFHLPYEEYILGYLNFSAKGTKREVFGMPIPNDLITADIRGEPYYKEYLEKVAKHQRYLVGKEGSDPDSPAPKPAKATKNSLSLVDEFVDEGIPEREPRFDDEEADMQRAVEESLKSVHDAHQGPLPPVVFREPDFGKFQPLSEVQGKGIEKRRTPAPTEPSSHAKSPSIYAELGLTDSDTESDEEVPLVVKIRAQDEGQAGPNPGDSRGPASSTGTLSSLQHLANDISFGDQFFNDKPSEAENKKTITKTKAESMVSVTIHQDTSAIPPMTSPVIDLISRPDSPNDHRPLPATMANLIQDNKHLRRVDEIVIDAVDWAIQAPLWNRFSDFPEVDMKEILHQRMWETNSCKAHEDHMMLYEALDKSMNSDHADELLTDLAEAQRK